MSIRNLSHIKKFFGHVDNPEEKQELYKEMLLMTLSRATRADLTTDDPEVAVVRRIILDFTGEDVSSESIRVAASSELYEKAPIVKYLTQVGQQINRSQRQSIAKALVEVFESDGKVTASECEFFNIVIGALKLTPAEAVGLIAD